MRVVLVLVWMVGVAYAQPGAAPPNPVAVPFGASEPIPPQVHRPEPELLGESTALWLSLGGTVASYTMWGLAQGVSNDRLGGTLMLTGALGTLLAPSFGHWYSGTFFTRGLGARAAGIGSAFVGLVVMFSCGSFFGGHEDENENCDLEVGAGAGLMLIGAGAWVYGTFDDIIQAPRRAARINEQRLSATYAIVPTASDERVGLALVGRF